MTSSISTTLHAIEVSPPLFMLQRHYTNPKVSDSWASFVTIPRISLPRFTLWLPPSPLVTQKHLHSSPQAPPVQRMNPKTPFPPTMSGETCFLLVLGLQHLIHVRLLLSDPEQTPRRLLQLPPLIGVWSM